MKRVRFLVLAMGMVILVGGISGQEKKAEPKESPKAAAKDDAKKAPTKARRQIPSGWSKLGLTAEQRKSIYEIDATYDQQIDALTTKITELKKEKYTKQVEVLTPEQKKHLQNPAKKTAGE